LGKDGLISLVEKRISFNFIAFGEDPGISPFYEINKEAIHA